MQYIKKQILSSTSKKIFYLGFIFLLVCGLNISSSFAQSWPSQTLKIIVPYPPGGAIDAMIRVLAPKLEEELKQPVIIENKPGAGGVVGTIAAKRMTDGHTLLMTAMGHVIAPQLNDEVAYDALVDFQAISPVALVPNVVVVPIDSPYESIQDIIDAARAAPGKLTYGSAGTGSSLHMAPTMFAAMADISMTHVPYRGSAPAINDLIAGRIDMLFDSSTSAAPHLVGDAKLRALAVATSERSRAFPDLPTIKEAGVSDYSVDWWYGLLAPADFPAEYIEKISTIVQQSLKDPEIQANFDHLKIDPLFLSTPDFQQKIEQDAQIWEETIDELGIQAN